MGDLGTNEVSTSDLAELIYEMLSKSAAGDVCIRIMTQASARGARLPTDLAELKMFITGPLFEAVQEHLDGVTALAVQQDLEQVLETLKGARSTTSGVQRRISVPPPISGVRRARSLPRQHRVLVVIPNPLLRRSNERAIAGVGCEVHVVNAASEVVSECRRLKPALVVTDMVLPGLSGHRLVRRLRRELADDAPMVIIVDSQQDQLRVKRDKMVVPACSSVELAEIVQSYLADMGKSPAESPV